MNTELTVAAGDIQRLRPADHAYPSRVLEVPGRARVLRALGDIHVLDQGPALAVLGTRTPDPEILKRTRRFIELSAEFAMVIVSGISPGVDCEAHQTALDLGLKTIAVPGCGLETLLQSDRGDLARGIIDAGGLVVSPFPSAAAETQERRWWRNRILAALCHGMVVVASEPDGGAVEAQRWARQLERRLIEPGEDDAV